MMNIAEQIEKERKLAIYAGEDRVESAAVVLEAYKSDNSVKNWYRSHLPTLDRILGGGFLPGQLVVVSGITGQGKTTLLQTFTVALVQQACRPLWLSYEVSCDDFLRPFEAYDKDCLRYMQMPLKLTGNTLAWIEDRLIESKLKYQSQALFIDHIHYIVSMSAKANMSFVIGETVRGLKQMALKHNVVVFLVAHMTKTKPDEEPSLGHVRDSSFIEQEADTVLYVWRWADDKRVTICKVAKNRKRGLIDDRIAFVLDRDKGLYFEKAVDEEEQTKGTAKGVRK